ncbi:PKD domain-containing protein [Spirosoma sp. KNUC1025]|uniref:PKD domain-containing protein n=1 Tax=Spirosoma sp. KNUC1025 TaxID=2894082 RepID=UPI003868528A|nr:PKD domain-containing protein [Spirosoma sp. KNUC1025]
MTRESNLFDWASILPLRTVLAPSKVTAIRYCSLLLFTLSMVLFTHKASAQLTSCPGGCGASDIKVKRVYLADANGNPLSNTCTPGSTVSAKICVEFDVTAQTRYGFYFGFQYKIGSSTYSQSQCYAQAFSQGLFTLCYPIAYQCGESVSLVSTLLGWGNQQSDLNTFCNASNLTCSKLSPKCFSSTNLPTVQAPLIANFSYNASCKAGNPVQTVAFSGTATGGTALYSYSWDLDGNGSFETSGQNPTFTYAVPGNYAVSLKVTDSNPAGAVTDIQTYTVTVASCPLPVTYTYFRAQSVGEGIQLEWKTSLEVNHDHFDVERSTNAIDFKRINNAQLAPVLVEPTGRIYRYIDTEPLAGTVYYRLKQVDIDGQASYSKILSVVSEDGTSVLDLSPNPVTDQLNLQIRSPYTGSVELAIIDLAGKRWSSLINQKTDPLHQQTIDTQHLPGGQYVVTVRLGDQYFVRKIIK